MSDVILKESSRTRSRRAPEAWRKVISDACDDKKYPLRGFGLPEIMELAKNHGVEISYGGLRVKLNRYLNKGYIKRISHGRYHVPVSGYRFFGLELHKTTEPKTAVPQTPPSRWSQKALKISETASTVAE